MRKNFVIFGIFVIFPVPIVFAGPIDDYDNQLRTYVHNGYVKYSEWQKDREGLDSYIAYLADLDIENLAREESLAAMLNAYNAFMVKLVLDNYPVKSVRDIDGVFKKKYFTLAGKKVSLDDVEHKYIRETYGEPRIHFAIVCGSIGCPDLRNEAYIPGKLDQQLDQQTRLYLSQDKGLTVKKGKKRKLVLHLSKIFNWFKDDFGDSEKERLRFISKYAPENWSKQILEDFDKIDIKYLDYDWNLNGR